MTAVQTETASDKVENASSKEYSHTVVAPAIDYWRTTIDNKKGAEVARLKAARIFNPLSCIGPPNFSSRCLQTLTA